MDSQKIEQIIYNIYFFLVFAGVGLSVFGLGLSVFAVGYEILKQSI